MCISSPSRHYSSKNKSSQFERFLVHFAPSVYRGPMTWRRPPARVRDLIRQSCADHRQCTPGVARRARQRRARSQPDDRGGPGTRRGREPQQPGQPVLLGHSQRPRPRGTRASEYRTRTDDRRAGIGPQGIRRIFAGRVPRRRRSGLAAPHGHRVRADLRSGGTARIPRRVLPVDQRVRRHHFVGHRGPDRPGARRTHPRHACRTSRDRRTDSRRRAHRPTARRGSARVRVDRTPHRRGDLERRPKRRPGPSRRRQPRPSGTPQAERGR